MPIAYIDWIYKKSNLYVVVDYMRQYIYRYRLYPTNISTNI